MGEYKINIVAYKGISFVSRLIRYWTRSEYSHVEVMRYNEETPCSLTSTIGSINFKGVMWWDINKHTLKTPYDIYEIEVTKEEYKEFWHFIYSKLGKDYDFKGILGYVFNVNQDKDKYYCSELIYYGLQKAGIDFWNHKKKYISPGQLVEPNELKLIKSSQV